MLQGSRSFVLCSQTMVELLNRNVFIVVSYSIQLETYCALQSRPKKRIKTYGSVKKCCWLHNCFGKLDDFNFNRKVPSLSFIVIYLFPRTTLLKFHLNDYYYFLFLVGSCITKKIYSFRAQRVPIIIVGHYGFQGHGEKYYISVDKNEI